MPRKPNLSDLKKRFQIRFAVFSLFFSIWLLVDELIKEGYLFSPEDVRIPGTHEFIITLIFVINLLILFAKVITKQLKEIKEE